VQYKNILAIIFNEIKCYVNTSLGLVGGICIPCILPCVRACTLRKTDINIVQQTSCETPFPDVQMQLKTCLFVPFVLPRMHHNYGVISGSHACRHCMWHIILDAELFTSCPGERVPVAVAYAENFRGGGKA